MLKKCKKCFKEKPSSSEFFPKVKGNNDGLGGSCKVCLREQNRAIRKRKGSEYRTWTGMKDRCYNKNYNQYKDYGGRGITVCDRWINSYENFLSDMGKKPNENHTLDRINNDKGYCPSNCRWSTRSEQVRNTRTFKTNTSGHKGVHWDKNRKKWMAYINVNNRSKFLGYFSDVKQAIEARVQGEIKYWEN